jgi:putative acetyltransferase
VALSIERADLTEPALHSFLQEHLDDMAPTAPPASRHALDLAGLRQPGVRLWVGRDAGRIVATVALAAISRGHEELKSMRTAPDRRGSGIARQMLGHLLADARARGVQRVSLETGTMAFFAPARALYRSVGFTECAPFGRYVQDPNSAYLTLRL